MYLHPSLFGMFYGKGIKCVDLAPFGEVESIAIVGECFAINPILVFNNDSLFAVVGRYSSASEAGTSQSRVKLVRRLKNSQELGSHIGRGEVM
jgi:hypothetical protein